jgi:RNA polymerase sigma factor (sigma-70 family)
MFRCFAQEQLCGSRSKSGSACFSEGGFQKEFVGFRFQRLLISRCAMTDDEKLLEEYARARSESAFGELVARHIDLVYSAALRVVNGDTYLAQDVTQTVFIDLARKARSLPRNVVLAGWLHRHTCYTAATAVRTERRRRTREQTAMEMRALDDNTSPAWEQIAPYLDEGLNQLSVDDRDALVLRFLRHQDFRAVGAALGISEDAAQKRVSRALDKLRGVLSRRGVALTAVALTSVLATQTVTAAPAGLAAGVTTASLAAGAKTGTTLSLLKFMATAKLKAGIVTAIVLASVVTPLVLHQKAEARLRVQEEVVRQRTDQLVKLQPENERLSKLLEEAKTSAALTEDQRRELLKLRGEVGRLRDDAQKLAKIAAFREEIAQLPLEQVWPARANHLKQWLEENPSEKIPEVDLVPERLWIDSIYPIPLETDEECRRAMSVVRANAQGSTLSSLDKALQRYGKSNDGQFPQDLSQLKPYFDPPINDEVLGRYTILPASNLVSEMRPGGDWVITEKAPINEVLDMRNAIGLKNWKMANQRVPNRWVLVP